MDDEADHIGALIFFVVLPGLEDGLALFEAEGVIDREVVLDDLLCAVPDGSPRRCEPDEFALDEVDVTDWTDVEEVLETVELKP